MNARTALWAALLAAAAAPAGAQQPAVETAAQRAAKMYTSAVSAMRTGQYDQAQGLFEKYVGNYATHEYVPVGYLLLAYCRHQLKDAKGRDEALEEVVRRYRHSPAWYAAYVSKLSLALQAKDHDAAVAALESMARDCLELPMDAFPGMGLEYGQYWQQAYHGRQFYPTAWEYGYIQDRPGWITQVVAAGDTPERAEKVLTALARTLRRREGDLPTDWQYARVQLLRQAGKADEAEALLREQLQAWRGEAPAGGAPAAPPDPRGIGLYLLWIQDAAARKDPPAVEAAWRELIETYRGAGSLDEPLYGRLAALLWAKPQRWEDFTALARRFLETYTTSRYWDSVVALWIDGARTPARQGDASRIAPALAMLDEFYGGRHDHPARARRGLLWRVELKILQGQVDQAAQLARRLLTQAEWSTASFQLLQNYAGTHPPFQALVAEARKEFRIPLPNPTTDAFRLLNKLRIRLKDDQVRHAEEIGEEMFAKHPQDPSTTEGVKLLADYYFSKVLPEPRDKWMQRMIDAYPLHPLTEAVLTNRITAEGAARRYDRQGKALDLMMERFGGSNAQASWYQLRARCHDALQDTAGKYALVKRVMGPVADTGDVRAMAELAQYEMAGLETPKEIGDAWVAKAKKFAGTRTELYCLAQAWSAYYYGPYRHYRPGKIEWEKGLEVTKRLRAQTLDPELSWRQAFGEVNLLAHQGKPDAALAALNAALKDRPKLRDLSLRLDFSGLGTALGNAKQTDNAAQLAHRLKGVCFTRRDRGAIELLQGAACSAEKDYEKAATHYLTAVNLSPFPSEMYPLFRSVAYLLQQGRSKQYEKVMEAYLRKVAGTQELVPALLYELGLHHFARRGAAALAARNRLAGRYPCSAARDLLEQRFEALRPKRAPAKKGPGR